MEERKTPADVFAEPGEQSGARGFQEKPRKKKNRRFNLLDLLILMTVAAVVAAALYAYLPGVLRKTGSGMTNVTMTFVIDSVPAEFASLCTAGDPVSFTDGNSLGTVTAVKSEPMTVDYVPGESGQLKKVNSSNLFRLTVTVSANLITNGGAYYCENERMAAGLDYDLRFRSFGGEALCVLFTPGG